MSASSAARARGRGNKRGRPAPAHASLGRAGEEGLGLVEVLVAVAIVGMTLVALLAAISTGSIGVTTTDSEVTAANLARSQLEYTRSQPYAEVPTEYATVTPPAGYTVSVQAASIPEPVTDANIQKITVIVARDGKTLATVEDYKVKR
jgi:Tfp pilus assembly protein PilV